MSDAKVSHPYAGGRLESPAEPVCCADELRYLWEAREKWERDLISMRTEGWEPVSRARARRILADGVSPATAADITDLPLAEAEAPHRART